MALTYSVALPGPSSGGERCEHKRAVFPFLYASEAAAPRAAALQPVDTGRALEPEDDVCNFWSRQLGTPTVREQSDSNSRRSVGARTFYCMLMSVLCCGVAWCELCLVRGVPCRVT